jgi:hypothetical protein
MAMAMSVTEQWTEEKRSVNLKHECFPQPKDAEQRVWRYLSLAKLVNLLTTKTLYLSRLDLLADDHEGSYTRIHSQTEALQIRNGSEREKWTQQKARVRSSLYVNCWRIGNEESEAMWKLYCPNNDGIAVVTSYRRLVQSALNDSETYIGLITYLDYETDTFKSGNVLYPAMHKRKAFEHEREARIVKIQARYWGETAESRVGHPPTAVTVEWDLIKHCEALYVNPYAPEWYFATIEKLLEALSVDIDLQWSHLKAKPFY